MVTVALASKIVYNVLQWLSGKESQKKMRRVLFQTLVPKVSYRLFSLVKVYFALSTVNRCLSRQELTGREP